MILIVGLITVDKHSWYHGGKLTNIVRFIVQFGTDYGLDFLLLIGFLSS